MNKSILPMKIDWDQVRTQYVGKNNDPDALNAFISYLESWIERTKKREDSLTAEIEKWKTDYRHLQKSYERLVGKQNNDIKMLVEERAALVDEIFENELKEK